MRRPSGARESSCSRAPHAARRGGLAPLLVAVSAFAAGPPPSATLPGRTTPVAGAPSPAQPTATSSSSPAAAAAAPADPAGSRASASLPTSFPVTIGTHVILRNLHPMAKRWSLLCGAIATSESAASTIEETINSAENAFAISTTMPNNQAAYDQFAQLILNPAHYHGSQATAGGDVVGGAYDGVKTVTMNVPVSQLVDPATKSVYTKPAVLVGCWIVINDRPAIRTRLTQIANKDNYNLVKADMRSEFMAPIPVLAAAP